MKTTSEETLTMYGYCNTVFFNLCPEGDNVWFYTQAERDRVLIAMRGRAITKGLSPSSARHGLVPIRYHIDTAEAERWLDNLEDGSAEMCDVLFDADEFDADE